MNRKSTGKGRLTLLQVGMGGGSVFLRQEVDGGGGGGGEIGRAHVGTPGTCSHLVCGLLLEKKKQTHKDIYTASDITTSVQR